MIQYIDFSKIVESKTLFKTDIKTNWLGGLLMTTTAGWENLLYFSLGLNDGLENYQLKILPRYTKHSQYLLFSNVLWRISINCIDVKVMENITGSSVGWVCVAHLSFCFEETLYRMFHGASYQVSVHLANGFRKDFLEINQSEKRIPCDGHVC